MYCVFVMMPQKKIMTHSPPQGVNTVDLRKKSELQLNFGVGHKMDHYGHLFDFIRKSR